MDGLIHRLLPNKVKNNVYDLNFSRNADVLSLKTIRDRYMITKPLKTKFDSKDVV